MKRVAVLLSGRGSNLRALHGHVAAGEVPAKIAAVLTDRADAPGAAWAKEAGLPVQHVRPGDDGVDGFDRRLAGALQDVRPDLVVLAGFMRILGRHVLDAFAGAIVNLHPSLLPAFPGARAVADALAAGAAITGCTTHIVTEDLDAGPIVLQAAVPVERGDTVATLRERIQAVEHHLLPRTVDLFARGQVAVDGARVRITLGGSWRERVHPVRRALYPEAF